MNYEKLHILIMVICMKINYKSLIINILIPVGLGALVGFLSGSSDGYKDMIQPSFAPPGIVFPIVWTILYTLMGISSYLISQSNSPYKEKALFVYYLQLAVNLLWSFVFFTFHLYFLAFLWILLLIGLVIWMIIKFLPISKTAAYLQIPYLLWISFASILNFSIYLLN